MLANVTDGDSESKRSVIHTHTSTLKCIHTHITHTDACTHMHTHSARVGVVSLRVAVHSEMISCQAKAAKYPKRTHTRYTLTRGTLRYLLSLMLLWCLRFNPLSSAVISNRSWAPPFPWQHRPGNHGPTQRIQGLAVYVESTPRVTTLQTDLWGQVYD